jgi:hypothetical protein
VWCWLRALLLQQQQDLQVQQQLLERQAPQLLLQGLRVRPLHRVQLPVQQGLLLPPLLLALHLRRTS